MKKVGRAFTVVFLIMIMLSFAGCNLGNDDYKNSQVNNRIYSKEAGIAEIKELLQVDSLHFFDCDFSQMPDITIVYSSYNISVWGQFTYDKELGRKVIDLSKQATVEIVANYKIESDSTCFGFSVVSEVMRLVSDHYGGKLENEIYTANTYKSFADLYKDSEIDTLYGPIVHISVSNDFYPQSLEKSINPVLYFRNYTADLFNICNLDKPIYVVTHFENYDMDYADSDLAIMQKIASFMNQNGIYKTA